MKFLTADEVVDAHRLLTANDEDRPTVRHVGAIESALERAEWGPFEGPADLAERAAFILRGICQDHAFTNGNKRTAFTATESFLQQNGQLIVASADEVVAFMLRVAAENPPELAEISEWLRTRIRNL